MPEAKQFKEDVEKNRRNTVIYILDVILFLALLTFLPFDPALCSWNQVIFAWGNKKSFK